MKTGTGTATECVSDGATAQAVAEPVPVFIGPGTFRIRSALRGIHLPDRSRFVDLCEDWLLSEGRWYAGSAVVHLAALLSLVLIPVSMRPRPDATGSIAFGATENEATAPPESADFNLEDTSLEPSELSPETLLLIERQRAAQKAQHNDDSPVFKEAGGGSLSGAEKGVILGGMGGFTIESIGPGPRVTGKGGVGVGYGTSGRFGNGGNGEGFGGRGSGSRPALAGTLGGTRATERSVAAALFWLNRHQNAAGDWSLTKFNQHCRGRQCTGPGAIQSDAGATAIAILPFLGAGQTHKVNGPYRDTVQKALFWLIKKQTSDGDLSAGSEQRMYAHGLATIALCEAYGMTKDPRLLNPAQAAVIFIERAQNRASGGWRYEPDSFGDTSVTGWQVMALKSAQMAGIAVNTLHLQQSEKWLQSVSKGKHLGTFSYQPYREPTPTMTAVGMLCRQYLGARSDDPAMVEGKQYLIENAPRNSDSDMRDVYYWYYATQVMFNLGGPEWDDWNRRVRRTLIEGQVKDGCGMGSWDPERPSIDVWGTKGGRVATTALSALTLEVYYRYLPLYRFRGDRNEKAPPAANPAAVENPIIAHNAEDRDPPPKAERGIGL